MDGNSNIRQQLVESEILLASIKDTVTDYVEIEGHMINKQDEVEYLERRIRTLKRRLNLRLVK